MHKHQLAGFKGYLLIWFGQTISLIGTAMTRFALTIWVFNETGSATVMAAVAFFSFAPAILISPIAGALVDRWDRKKMMMLADAMAGLSTVFLLCMFLTGNLKIWHLYAAGLFGSAFESLQWPAYSASISLMLDKKDYARASGMMSIAESGSMIGAPVLAAFLLSITGPGTVMMIDVATFIFAVGSMMLIFIPNPKKEEGGGTEKESLLKESLFGFKYIWNKKPLLGMQIIFLISNLFTNPAFVLMPVLILSKTASNNMMLASVEMAMGIGGVAGGLLVSIWGGPKKKAHGVFMGMFLGCLLGQVLLGLANTAFMWIAAAFLFDFFLPLVNSSNQSIWQSKVPPALQGRVFSVRRLIAQAVAPIAMIASGPLADYVFEPAMMPGGALSRVFGPIVGTGTGAGIALIIVITGALGAIGGLLGYMLPQVRNIETIMPDHNEDGSTAACS